MVYTHASLFSGIGGAELAASWLGWDNVFHCEIQEFQRKVLEYWFPNTISYEDITKTDFSRWRGHIDVLTGGFPCQPFSVAGKRKGAEDNRYLWTEMLRAIRQIQPTWVVGENVAGLLSMVQPGKTIKVGRADDLFDENFIYRTEQQFTIDAICEDLEHAGYSVQPIVIPACAVGAPHRRDRVWIVAHADGNRQRQREDEQIIERECKRTTDVGNGCKNESAANTQCSGGEEMVKDVQSELADCPQGWWRDFPTQSPVCRGNDGLPFRMADLTISFPKWRSKSIEALGNAWVPQVAYEIFKTISNFDNPEMVKGGEK